DWLTEQPTQIPATDAHSRARRRGRMETTLTSGRQGYASRGRVAAFPGALTRVIPGEATCDPAPFPYSGTPPALDRQKNASATGRGVQLRHRGETSGSISAQRRSDPRIDRAVVSAETDPSPAGGVRR